MRIAYLSALLFISVIGFAQAPQRFSFQAVVRHPDTSLVTFKQISVRLSILKGDINGTVVYSETHSPRTNGLGLFTLEVGGGMVQSGDFSSIAWGSDSYFIKREIDPTGGTNYTISGTSQMLSVPYALHAEIANKISNQFEPFNLMKSACNNISFTLNNESEYFTIPSDSFMIIRSFQDGTGKAGNHSINEGEVFLGAGMAINGGSSISVFSPNFTGATPPFYVSGCLFKRDNNLNFVTKTLNVGGNDRYTVPEGKSFWLFSGGYLGLTARNKFDNPLRLTQNGISHKEQNIFNSGDYFIASSSVSLSKITVIGILFDIKN